MNKKFSTLLCASLLVSSAFVANAAVDDLGPASTAVASTELKGAGTYAVPYFESATPSGVYQLECNGKILAVVEDGDGYKYQMVKPGEVDLQYTLWCVTITEQVDRGQDPIFDFVNKATGAIFAFDDQNISSVGNAYGGWAFSPTWKKDEGGLTKQMLYTEMEDSQVLALKAKASDTPNRSDVYGVKISREDAIAARAKVIANQASGYLELTIQDAGAYVLSAAEINAYLKDNKDVLTFTPDGVENPFSTTAFVAEPTVTTGNDDDNMNSRNFVYITQKDNEKMYLKVDTATYNTLGEDYLKFGWSNTAEPKNDALTGDIADQHKFLFIYKPSGDSLFIQVKQVTYLNRHDESNLWYSETAKTIVKKYGDDYLGLPLYSGDDDDDLTVNNPSVASNANELFVKLQDLEQSGDRITIGKRPIDTHIGFGAASCFAATDRISLADGVYVIYNEKGQVLAAPIELNDNSGNNEAQWVTLDTQDPTHMPAYQWVITKTLEAEGAAATSPVKIVNREFTDLSVASVQLKKDEDGNYIGKATIKGTEFVFDKGKFEQITDETILGDKKLGYRFIPSDSLMVNKYVFNYLNPFTDEYWIANGGEDDSVMYVKTDRSRYTLVMGSTSGYGYGQTEAEAKVLEDLGIAKLERTNYVINMPNTDLSMVEAYDKKYSMGVTNYDVEPYVVDSFYFKENNHYAGKHYYAILQTSGKWTKEGEDPIYAYAIKNAEGEVVKYVNAEGTDVTLTGYAWADAIIKDIDETNKAGIADDGKDASLKVQLLNETRTSAFTVEPDNTPLYRRFNNTLLGETEGTDSLVFVEKYRGEYLMDENNDSFKGDLDYAGIWNKEEAEGHLAFIVDTAWVTRNNGYIKPQYLISTARLDQDEVATIPCQEDGPHITPEGVPTDDPYQCVHATQGKLPFHYGKYLVSFADSVANLSDEDGQYKKPYMDVDGGYTRVGFVKAIHSGDSLYILTNGFETMQPTELDTAMIIKAYTEQKINKEFIVNLQGDQHKNVTWSFRYVNPDMAAQAYIDGEEGENNEFLFESNIYDENGEPINVTDTQGKAAEGFDHAVAGSIAPQSAAWLKSQNGCLVLTRGDSKFDLMTTGSDGALIFNAYQKTEDQDMVTSNEEIAVEGVSVVAGNGQVTIQGAAGKTVVITNILGKVVANTVLTTIK